MALIPKGLSFSRQILPVLALAGLIVAVILIVRGQPDRAVESPDETPPRATGALANAPRVAGAGIVEPSSEIVDIGTSLSGLVMDVAVEAGDFVTRGDLLFTVDQRAARAALAEAEAAIARAEAAIAQARTAERTAARQLELYAAIDDRAAVSRAEVITAEGAASTARAQLALAVAERDSARAARQSAEVELGRLNVRAPISGEVLRVDVRAGEYVQAGGPQGSAAAPYIRIGETRPLHVRIDIDEDDAGRVNIGAEAIVSPRGAADRQVKASFVRAEPLIVPKTSLTNSSTERVDVRVLQLIYKLPMREDGLFRVGQQVDAFIPARPQPETAEAEDGDGR